MGDVFDEALSGLMAARTMGFIPRPRCPLVLLVEVRHMTRIVDRIAFAIIGALALALIAVLAGIAGAGPLDPPAGRQARCARWTR
jgi:hypothetical protein